MNIHGGLRVSGSLIFGYHTAIGVIPSADDDEGKSIFGSRPKELPTRSEFPLDEDEADFYYLVTKCYPDAVSEIRN